MAYEKAGIGAADITKLKLNGYYTVAVMSFPHRSTSLRVIAQINVKAVSSFCDSQNTSESQGLQRN